MKNNRVKKRDGFSSKFGVIAAAAGSAIGLGNIWRFPYVLGNNGGAAFLIIYLIAIVGIGIPVMLSEFSIGRMTQRNAFGAFKQLKPKSAWYLVGIMGILAAFLIMSFYSTVAGWTMEYLYQAITHQFQGQDTVSLDLHFKEFIASGTMPVIWQMIFILLTSLIVVMGIKNGIEKSTKILMPMLFVIIIILVIRSITLTGAGQGLRFLFTPDFSKITPMVILEAIGQAFFSLSIGMGVLITYGSYIQKDDNLIKSAVFISLSDTLIALLSGIAIFPAVFAFGIEPNSGPGLVFITLPNLFNQMPAGYIFSIFFFILLLIAALTSSISLLEVVVAFVTEQFHWKRKPVAFVLSFVFIITGLLSTLSLGSWSHIKVFGLNFFDLFDWTSANLLLPLGGLLIVIFTGWVLNRKALQKEILNGEEKRQWLFNVFMFSVKYISPVILFIMFLFGLGLFS